MRSYSDYGNSSSRAPDWNNGNLIKALTLQKKLDEVPQLLDHIYRDHWQYAEDLDKLSVWCAEAIYYHARHDEGKRNQCIASIQEKTSDHLTVMDIFADYYGDFFYTRNRFVAYMCL